MEDNAIKYAVVRADTTQKSFTVWHEDAELAQREAVRLAQATNSRFYVVKTIGYAKPISPPVDWVDCVEAKSFLKANDF